jgi:glutathione S-transferase
MSLILHEMADMHYSLGQIAYPPRAASNIQEVHDSLRKDYAGTLEGKLGRISKFIGSGPWVAGERLTYVDFYVYDILDYNRQLFLPTHVAAFPNLVAYMERFEGLKGVKEFLASDKFSRLPIYSPFAMFGQNKDYKPTE